MKRIPSLDGLRAISILLVLVGHLTNQPGRGHAPFLLEYAVFGVRVFFVLSGFLITTLLMEEKERTGGISLIDFYRRRLFRITPPAFVFMVVISATCWRALSRADLICAWTYTVDFLKADHAGAVVGHLWSLSVEEQFYLLWPVLLVLFWRHRVKILIASLCIAPLFRLFFLLRGDHNLAGIAFPCVQDALASGCLLALHRDKLNPRLLDRFAFPLAVFTMILPVVHHPRAVDRLLTPTLMNVGIALLIDHCIRKRYAALNWGPVIWVGMLSYSLYLWQQPFLNTWWQHAWTAFPLNLVLAFGCAISSYYLVERPSLALRRTLEQRKRRRAEYLVTQ